MLSEAIGVTGEDIMFSSNDTPAEEFAYAEKLGAIINLDDITHIDFPGTDHRPYSRNHRVRRYNSGGLFKISNDIMDNPGDSKYGMTTEQLFESFKILKEKGQRNSESTPSLPAIRLPMIIIRCLRRFCLNWQSGFRERLAYISSLSTSPEGIGIPYTPDQEPNDIRMIGDGVRRVYEEVLTPAGMGDVAIYTELGRFMMGPYGCLVTKAIHEKHTHKEYKAWTHAR